MQRIPVNKIEFYITNVCNLTCDNCNRFNHLNFKGWQDWKQYADLYQQWSQLLEINHIVILGGEPLLNPTVCDWAKGLAGLWNQSVQILSNGTRVNFVKDLYETLSQNPIWMGVTVHNINELDNIVDQIIAFLKPPVQKIVGDNEFGAPLLLIDTKHVRVPIWISNYFQQNALLKDSDGAWTLHDSDPQAAHEICCFAQGKSYHFIKGKLYKCGPVALLPELDQQIGLKITDTDRAVLQAYKPLTLENFEDYHREFFLTLDDPIPQCKFCPSYGGGGNIWPLRKGIVAN